MRGQSDCEWDVFADTIAPVQGDAEKHLSHRTTSWDALVDVIEW